MKGTDDDAGGVSRLVSQLELLVGAEDPTILAPEGLDRISVELHQLGPGDGQGFRGDGRATTDQRPIFRRRPVVAKQAFEPRYGELTRGTRPNPTLSRPGFGKRCGPGG